MKRMFYIDCYYGGTEKYKFQKEYEGFGIYQRMTPSGYYSHQDYLITNGDKIVVSQSYNNLCFDEILDMIDNYNETKKFGRKAIKKNDSTNNCVIYYLHNSGTMI